MCAVKAAVREFRAIPKAIRQNRNEHKHIPINDFAAHLVLHAAPWERHAAGLSRGAHLAPPKD